MGEPIQGSGQHNRRLDEDLAREPGAEEETPAPELWAPELWNAPGHDGVVGDSDSDPDRADLRSEIGQYASLATFPTEARALVAAAEQANASEAVLANLRRLEPDARFSSPTQLWDALGLSFGPRVGGVTTTLVASDYWCPARTVPNKERIGRRPGVELMCTPAEHWREPRPTRADADAIKGFAGSGFDMKMVADVGMAVAMGVRR